MKQLFSVLVILCWLTPPLQSQQPGPEPKPGDGGLLESYKIGWLTRRLAFTPEEAQKFWPIYGLYTKEVRQAYQVFRNDKNRIELEETLLNIKKKYSLEFVKAIPPGKINDFFNAEIEFNNMVRREQLRRQQMQGRPYPPPPNR
jgi:hypothetical protein